MIDFHFIWKFNMATKANYAFWLIEILKTFFSETTHEMELFFCRNVPYIALKKVFCQSEIQDGHHHKNRFNHTTIYRGKKISDTRNRLNPHDTYIIIALSFLFFCVDQKSKVTDFIGNYSTMERRRFFLF